MGNCCSDIHFRGKQGMSPDQINMKIEEYKNSLRLKILFLGSGESGKSTVLRQIRNVNNLKLTEKEIKEIAVLLRRNAIESMKNLIERAKVFGYDFGSNKENATLLEENDPTDMEVDFEKIGTAISILWHSEALQKTYERRNEYWLLEASSYYFDNVERFVEHDFIPTEEDITMARIITTGITTIRIDASPFEISMVDVGGQRSERKKWLNCFDNVNAIFYLVNAAGYNTVLYEDETQNRLQECLDLFDKTVNNPIFENTLFFLIFNKKDLFEDKIKTAKINVCEFLKDYSGPGDTVDCLEYIDKKFKAVIKGNASRVSTFYIAARFKKDVKATWEEILNNIKEKNKKEIDEAIAKIAELEMTNK